VHAVLVLVQERARAREAERAGCHTFADDLRHCGELIVGRHVVLRVAALAHHVRAHGRVRHLRADVDRARHPLEGIEVFGERLPIEAHAFGER
jgi:hypothetical protein